MKEYKLFNWYPSLPTEWADGHIVVVEREDGYHLHPSLKGQTRQLEKPLPAKEVEYNTFYWERVLPQETMNPRHREILDLLEDYLSRDGAKHLRFTQALYNLDIYSQIEVDGNYYLVDNYNDLDSWVLSRMKKVLKELS